MKGRAVLFGGLMLLAASASAQNVFSFDDIPIDKEPTIEVDLGPEMLKLLGEASKGEAGEPGVVALDGITNVRFRMYEDIDEDMQDVLRFVDATATRLQADGWQAVVRIRDGTDLIRVYMKPGVDGITVMVTEIGGDDGDSDGGGEAVFVNLAGKIQPSQLGRLASGIGVNGVLNGLPGLQGAPSAAPE